MTTPQPAIHVIADPPERAAQLANDLGLPLTADPAPGQLVLRWGEKGLEILKYKDPVLGGGIRAEFVHGRAKYRRTVRRREHLFRAAGIRPGCCKRILDATGGLGRDAFLLASTGCRVDVWEQHPVIARLLADGLDRALADPGTRDIAGRITLHVGDALEILARSTTSGEQPEVIYLDPMFPPRKKSARVKKELQMLQLLLGNPEEDQRLLQAALSHSGCRVVVKRPHHAPWLAARKPSWSIQGRSIRFDVYQNQSRR